MRTSLPNRGGMWPDFWTRIYSSNLTGLDSVGRPIWSKSLKTLNTEHCTCGCGLTVAQCRLDDPDCTVSLPLAQQLVDRIAKSK